MRIITQLQANTITGTNSFDDDVVWFSNGDKINGGGGNDTLVLGNPFANYNISDITAINNATIYSKSANFYAYLTSIEYLQFQDKLIKLSDLMTATNNPPTGSVTISGTVKQTN